MTALASRLSTPVLFVGLCAVGMLSMVFTGAMVVAALFSGGAPWAPIESCCGGAVAKFSVGWALLMGIGLVSLTGIFRMSLSLFAHRRASRRLRSLRGVSTRQLLLGHECWLIEDQRPISFCAGLFKPEIFISKTVVDRLSSDELSAVLAHEAHHQRRFDPLRYAVIRAMGGGLFFLPILSQLGQKCIERSEIAADCAAAEQRPGGRKALASAFLSLHERQPGGIMLSPERMDGLAGIKSSWVPDRSVSLLTIGSLSVLLAGSVAAAELVTKVPVGVEALGLHICLAALIAAPLVLTAGVAWTRPRVRV